MIRRTAPALLLFTATGTREIAEEADLSLGNLYDHFAGKDELLFFCQERTGA